MKTFYTLLLIVSILSCTKPEQDELSVKVTIPNAFVPMNKDGTVNTIAPCQNGGTDCNSVFQITIYNPNNHEIDVSMDIDDSNGRDVFSSTSSNPQWDGTENNKRVNFCRQGNYHYFIKVTEVANDKSRIFEGDVALLR